MLVSMLKKVDDAKILKSPYELSLNFSYGKHDKGMLLNTMFRTSSHLTNEINCRAYLFSSCKFGNN